MNKAITGQNRPEQDSVILPNSIATNDSVSSRYALLTRYAELDLELARDATALGMTADLIVPKILQSEWK